MVTSSRRVLPAAGLLLLVALSSAGCSKGIKGLMKAAAESMQPDPPLQVRISRYGTVETTPAGDYEPAPLTTTGQMRPVELIGFLDESNRVAATLGTSWGIEYVVSGGSDASWVRLEMHTIHPPLTNPDTGETTTLSRWLADVPKGEPSHRFYTLEYDWEVVPGEWTFEIYFEGELMARQEFVLYRPGEP